MKAYSLLTLPYLISLVAGQFLFDETWRQPKKVLISSHYGGYSHAKPILQIGHVLKQRGYEVSFASFTPFLDLAKPWGFNRLSMGEGSLPMKEYKEIMKEATRNSDRDSIMKIVTIMWDITYESSYRQLTRILTEEKPSFVMCDVFNFGCIDAAYHLNIPFSVQLPSLGLMHSVTDTVTDSLDKRSADTDTGILSRFNRNFRRRFRFLWSNWCFSRKANQDRIKVGSVARQEFGYNNMDKGVIFVNSFFGVDKPKYLPPNVHLVGPLLSPEYPPLTPDLKAFLDSHPRVVYIAFGTHMQLEQSTIERILTSVSQLLHDKAIDGVIWPISASSIEEFPKEILINNNTTTTTTTTATIPTEPILKNQDASFRMLDFAPQFSILSHPNTVLFVSHGGLDSSNEALVTATKILNIPAFGDHFYNAVNLQSCGVSIPMEITTFTSSEMTDKAKLLLEDKGGQFASNLRRMQVLAQISSKRIHYAADVVEQLIYAGKPDEPMTSIYQSPESRLVLWKRYDLDIYLILIGAGVSLPYLTYRSLRRLCILANQSAKVKKL
ncbi:UDP-Glycosyltransferase/glycogen phosphorylase [Basidiobolus meristosporus CBS 931.73]|uniref:UDP-Glycosyltransferase/glycogen phosphorylase n=1 Tax=Basidiobolus meristosporus CBS 931.73 TaxID=1314790 RepID=A0A1Y1YU32_9FUNG|nr:UDP-Glycosyltransferase/glycogen phosphorylase [Basidiobolus meristosporus CBS 931.73]|eukprot:ORY01237.1 UDP-Glycosyltransferase/glycogen phosphorylase [Basidiobolus meristosporus CBS 931.73]